MTTYDWLQEKWKKKETIEKKNRITKHFAKNETLAVINEKARLRGMTYGKYVQARENGMFEEDYGTKVNMNHSPKFAFCKVRKISY